FGESVGRRGLDDALGLGLVLGFGGFECLLLKLSGRLGHAQSALRVGRAFVHIAVAFHPGKEFAAFGAPEQREAVRAVGGKAFAVQAAGRRGHRTLLPDFANYFALLQVPLADRAVSPAREQFFSAWNDVESRDGSLVGSDLFHQLERRDSRRDGWLLLRRSL